MNVDAHTRDAFRNLKHDECSVSLVRTASICIHCWCSVFSVFTVISNIRVSHRKAMNQTWGFEDLKEGKT